MKNDPYLKLIFASIALGLFLALVSTHIHAAVPLPPLHVTADAPLWQQAFRAQAARLAHAAPAPAPVVAEATAPIAPAMPAPAAVNLHLGS
jgi:hypothetical protein